MLYYQYEKAREGTFGMARKIGFSKVPWLGVLAGLLGYFFHATMLSSGSAIPLIAFSVLMALLFWLRRWKSARARTRCSIRCAQMHF